MIRYQKYLTIYLTNIIVPTYVGFIRCVVVLYSDLTRVLHNKRPNCKYFYKGRYQDQGLNYYALCLELPNLNQGRVLKCNANSRRI